MRKRLFALLTAVSLTLTCCGSVNISREPENAESYGPAEQAVEENEQTPIYDDTAVIEAYLGGDPSALGEKDRAIYDEALKVIPEFYTDGMSEEETVVAAHDWIVTNLVYDEGELLAIPKKTPDTENPYGALILRQGICMGYTTLFQLFMDMLGVECQIVRGEGYSDDSWEEHAWNLVKIGGSYYHVDTTWDDFVPDEEGRMPFHLYTLVPDCAMEAAHTWNRDDYPAANAYDLIYYKTHGLYAGDADEVAELQKEACDAGERYFEVMTDKSAVTFAGGATGYWENDFGDYIVTVYWLFPF